MDPNQDLQDDLEQTGTPGEELGEKPEAWTLIDTGRYQPRRIRGSCLGRELG